MIGVEHATAGVLVIILFVFFLVFRYIRLAKEAISETKPAALRQDLYIRRLAGVDAVDEATGRAAELGRPMVFSTGLTGVGPVLYACLGVLHYVARKAARYKTKIIVPQNDSSVMAIASDTVQEAYRAEGKSYSYDPRSLVYLSDEQFAFAAGYMGLVQREKAASTFLFGVFAAESLILAEAGQQVGAMQIASSVSPEQVPFFICTCDYTLIGEELFGASAYLTREPVQVGSLFAQDRVKLLFFVFIIIGVMISTFNSFRPKEERWPSPVELIVKPLFVSGENE
jgi:hypothetical protein